MTASRSKVLLREIPEEGLSCDFSEKDDWVSRELLVHDERELALSSPKSSRNSANESKRAVELAFQLRLVEGGLIMVQGRLQTELSLCCSRCAERFSFPVSGRFTQLFTLDASMAGDGPTYQNGRGKTRGVARTQAAHLREEEGDPEISLLDEEQVDLQLVFGEQLELRKPYAPVCQENCKGVCPNCGANLNRGTCACHKLRTGSLAGALANVKIHSTRT
jgi:uncharacterized protein